MAPTVTAVVAAAVGTVAMEDSGPHHDAETPAQERPEHEGGEQRQHELARRPAPPSADEPPAAWGHPGSAVRRTDGRR